MTPMLDLATDPLRPSLQVSGGPGGDRMLDDIGQWYKAGLLH